MLDGDRLAWWAAAAAIALAIGALLAARWRLGRAGRRLRRRAGVAQAGETRAVELLSSEGYTVTSRQAVARWQVRAGDQSHEVLVRADYLVERDGKVFVAEVKTGDEAPSVTSRATRRQLLEYLCAFAADGVLLVDASGERVDEIEFALPSAPRVRSGAWALLLALIAGALLGGYVEAKASAWWKHHALSRKRN